MTTNNSGERLSFFQLLAERDYIIEIPKIQRDYAQGRKNAKDVRTDFLGALYNYLDENKPNRDLDFIYGSLSDNVFIPLDGQQRLTTLFLLHWYMANIASQRQALLDAFLRNNGSKFVYQTRPSSSEFCTELIRSDIFNRLLSPDEGKNNAVSKTIKNEGWFFLSWKNDPTISSMLSMIDAIEAKFRMRQDFFDRLFNLERRIITFQMLYLNEYKLTDDLYIKMNSRGELLTSFETFKAKLEQHIKNEYASERYDNKSLSDYISYNFDRKWADLFWQYKDKKKFVFDTQLMAFIHFIFGCSYAEIYDPKSNFEFLETLLDTDASYGAERLSFNRYNEVGAITKESVKFLVQALDVLCNGNRVIKSYFDFQFFDANMVFTDIINSKNTYAQRIRFYAYLIALIKSNNINSQQLFQWMRVVFNLTENAYIDNVFDAASLIKQIKSIYTQVAREYDGDILAYLRDDNKISAFPSWQIEEEKTKALLIGKSTKWENVIYRSERHEYFKGQVGFLLDFSGIRDAYSRDKTLNWSITEEENYFDSISSISSKAMALFDEVINDSSDVVTECLLERALLTKGDYLIQASANRKNFANRRGHRDYSWKRLLRYDKALSLNQVFFKELINDFSPKPTISEDLRRIIASYLGNDWRKLFIKNKDVIKYCGQGFITNYSNKYFLLLGQSQLNHYHAELTTYYMYLSLKEKYNDIDYYYVKSSNESPCLFFDFKVGKKGYQLSVYCDDNISEFKRYQIGLRRIKKRPDNKIDFDKLQSTIKLFDLKEYNDCDGYWYFCDNYGKAQKKTTEFLQYIVTELSSLD